MNLEDVVQELQTIERVLEDLLEEPSKRALQMARRPLQKRIDSEKKQKREKNPWKFAIPTAEPVRFKECRPNDHVKHALAVDISGKLSKPQGGLPTDEHNIAVRVWSSDRSMWFREHLDAADVPDRCVHGRRVMLRFHFDHASDKQNGPTHHLQIGGKPLDDELAWLPDNWKLPRFAHYPVSLLMACDFIVRNFFPFAYKDVAKEASWRGCMSKAQSAYLVPYLQKLPFVRIRSDGDDLLTESCLHHWWNIKL